MDQEMGYAGIGRSGFLDDRRGACSSRRRRDRTEHRGSRGAAGAALRGGAPVDGLGHRETRGVLEAGSSSHRAPTRSHSPLSRRSGRGRAVREPGARCQPAARSAYHRPSSFRTTTMTTMAPISVMMPMANLRRPEGSQEASHRRFPLKPCQRTGGQTGPAVLRAGATVLPEHNSKRPRKLAPPGSSSVSRVRGGDRYLVPPDAALPRRADLPRRSPHP